MDAARKTTEVEEVHKKCDPEREEEEFGDWLRKLKKSVIFCAACMIYSAIRLIWFAISAIPYSCRMLHVVVPSVVSIVGWVIIIILMVSELPMKKRAWMRIYQSMVNIAGIGIIAGVSSVVGINLGMI